MNWIDKLERKFGRHGGIQNLTVYIIICYVIGYLLTYMNPSLLSMMSLDVSKILQGQIWRLVTWVIYPPSTGNFLLFAISILRSVPLLSVPGEAFGIHCIYFPGFSLF